MQKYQQTDLLKMQFSFSLDAEKQPMVWKRWLFKYVLIFDIHVEF